MPPVWTFAYPFIPFSFSVLLGNILFTSTKKLLQSECNFINLEYHFTNLLLNLEIGISFYRHCWEVHTSWFFFCLLSILSNLEGEMCHYLDSKHSSPARCWLTYIHVDSLKHLLFGNSAVQTGKMLACFCLFYCRLSWQELLPNLKTSLYWSHFSVLRLEQGILSGLRQMASFLFMSAAQFSSSTR